MAAERYIKQTESKLIQLDKYIIKTKSNSIAAAKCKSTAIPKDRSHCTNN